jgi:tetrahydrodipicolinate N-succinyltransferase
MESQLLAGVDKEYASNQDVVRVEITQRDTLLQQIQDALKSLLSGKERFSALLMQNASTLAEHKHKAILEKMNTAIKRLDGWQSIADQNRQLMAYQLDERNKLLIGLYSFVERREDVAPEWKDMATMIAGLGDSGGGWLTPS